MIRLSSPTVLSVNLKPATVKILTHNSDDDINKYYHEFIQLFKDGNPERKKVKYEGKYLYAEMIPCGNCAGCRLEYSRQWAIRCTLEALQHECNYFVTLTYDDLNLPTNPYCVRCDKNGVVTHDGHSHPLMPDHLKKFIKDLRAWFQYEYGLDGIRFFASGEYGNETQRPHFHIILFGCPLVFTDEKNKDFSLKFYKRNFQEKPLFNSPLLDKLWKKGYAVVAECNFDTCAYVARYIMKKQKGLGSSFYYEHDLTPEFSRMSRMPGIGRTFYDVNRDQIYTHDQITLLGADGKAITPCPPKYFDKLYADQCEDRFDDLKNERKAKQALQERSREYLTGLSKATSIHMEQRARDRVVIALKRGI